MIIYDKSFWGVALLLRLYGSAFPRSLPAGLLSIVFTTLLIVFVKEDQLRTWWVHPFPYQVFSSIVGFILVFRCNYGYQRYWEGRTNLQSMMQSWLIAAIEIMSFDKYNTAEEDEAATLASKKFRAECLHLISLMHSVSCQGLRRDPEIGNLDLHSKKLPAPPSDPADIPSGTANYGGLPTHVNWKDVFMLRASTAHVRKYNRTLPLTVLGGISEQERHALACERKAMEKNETMFKAYEDSTCCHLHVPYMERPYVVMMWLQQLLTDRSRSGGMEAPAPLLAGSYRMLAEGLRGYDQCRKLADTPFPFPWAQFILVLLVFHTVTVPLLITAYIRVAWLAILLSGMSVITYWTLNEVARDMEDPFLYEPNELPLPRFTYDFNETLATLLAPRRPPSLIGLAPLDDLLVAYPASRICLASPAHRRGLSALAARRVSDDVAAGRKQDVLVGPALGRTLGHSIGHSTLGRVESGSPMEAQSDDDVMWHQSPTGPAEP